MVYALRVDDRIARAVNLWDGPKSPKPIPTPERVFGVFGRKEYEPIANVPRQMMV